MESVETKQYMDGRGSKRLRKDSSDDILIEELFPDDLGYDADVEPVHPDQYEEAESDAEVTATPKRKFHSIDDELASRMKHLGHERSGTNSPQTPVSLRGRKRSNLHEDSQIHKSRHSDLEIMELVDRSTNKSPPKKRRKRSRPDSLSQKSDSSRVSLAATPDKVYVISQPEAHDVTMDMT